jgi:hypothetical protein
MTIFKSMNVRMSSRIFTKIPEPINLNLRQMVASGFSELCLRKIAKIGKSKEVNYDRDRGSERV